MHHCPRCKYPKFDWNGTCPQCGFCGDPVQIEELSRLEWLLGEIDSWIALGVVKRIPKRIQDHYVARHREVQSSLGLLSLPLAQEDQAQAWPEYRQHEALFQEVENWLKIGLLKTGLLPERYARLLQLRAQLQGYQGPAYPQSDRERLDEVNFLLDAVYDLEKQGEFATKDARWNLISSLIAEKSRLEKILSTPLKATPPPVPVVPEAEPAPVEAPVSMPPPPPRPPLRERLWRSILSERTLQALLFLGIFLLFVAAISFVVWGWKDFSAPVRVAIPFGFTALFLGLGHAVRVRTQLHRSALALSAIAALLIPIDCYTIYANYGSPPNGWTQFWLLTSLACLIAYILAALQIQSRFFGYITGVAAGSTALASLDVGTPLARDWYSAALSILAVGMLLTATQISRSAQPGRWWVFGDPFRYMALWAAAVLMPLTLGIRLIFHNSFDTYHYAMTVTWFVGGFIFGWGAIQYRSRSLGLLAAIALPISVYMAQGAIFDKTGTNPAWHAFGLACLAPLYIYAGHRLSRNLDNEVLLAHGRTASRWGIVLVVVTALLSLTDLTSGTAAATTHAVLAASMVLETLLWQRPRTVFAASLFTFTATTFAMTELNLSMNQLGVGWISLAILHILLTFSLVRNTQQVERRSPFLRPLISAGYGIAALAILPPVLLYDGPMLSYALGNWIALSAWGAYLASRGQPGFLPANVESADKPSLFRRLFTSGAVYHWLTAVPMPLWLWVVVDNNRAPDSVFPSALAALAWFMILLSHRLRSLGTEIRLSWRLTGLAVSAIAPLVAFANVPDSYVPCIVLLVIGLLYFTDTFLAHERSGFYMAGLVTALGMWLLLERAEIDPEIITFAFAVLVSAYILLGVALEHRKSPEHSYRFLGPLYATAHLLTFIVLLRVYIRPLDELLSGHAWTDSMQLWGAADQLLLAFVYGLYAWSRYQEGWAHLAAWLGMIGGGFVAIVYSEGHGSLSAKGALIAVAMVLAERALFSWRQRPILPRRTRAGIRLAWRLYRQPLLVAGWTASVGIIILSLIRNLILLGGGWIQQTWAAAGLLIITALYALSAYLFRRARFVWFAVVVLFAPWTILTNLGWFTNYKPALSEFAVSWIVLGWLLFLVALFMARRIPASYISPLKTATHILLPFSMLWAIADTSSSLFTIGMSIALYGVSAWLAHRQADLASPSALKITRFFYPALGLFPLWGVYWLDQLVPTARHEHFGLVILPLALLGLLAGRRLERAAPRLEWQRSYGMPAYLTAYISLIVGIMLVAHRPVLLALALLYAAVLMLLSAWTFRNALWLYPTSLFLTLSLLTMVGEANIPVERRGWWLMGLAAIHLVIAWVLRRDQHESYSAPLIVAGFALIALGLPPSSQDQVGAIWGYGSAALLYTVSAFWLKQPILLIPACTFILVPYANILQRSSLETDYYGLSLFPGAFVALALAWTLDRKMGVWKDFPWDRPGQWMEETAKRLLEWWALPLYALGFGLASAAPFFNNGRPELAAQSFALLAAVYGWAVFRFRLRAWLVLSILSTHYALAMVLDFLGLWKTPDAAWLRFVPLPALLMAMGLWIEKRWAEEPPSHWKTLFIGWSRPFYLFVFVDIIISEIGGLRGTLAGAGVSLINAVLIAIMASRWRSNVLPYVTTLLGGVALLQWRAAGPFESHTLPIHLAALAFGYGFLGFGYNLLRKGKPHGSEHPTWHTIWEVPLQRSAILISLLALVVTPILGANILAWSLSALIGLPFREFVDVETVFMFIWVFSLVGLLYTVAAAVYEKIRLGYLAIGMLLAAWFLYAFYVSAWDTLRQIQWYAIPAGLYLLGIAFVEWQRGNKNFARWLDYAAILLMLGSLFWQTLVFGWQFALLLGSEGLIAFWWGSARRLRRFFYAGMSGVILAALGQLLNALQEVNQWITFGLMGLLLVLAAIVVERRLEAIKAWQQQVLETWE